MHPVSNTQPGTSHGNLKVDIPSQKDTPWRYSIVALISSKDMAMFKAG